MFSEAEMAGDLLVPQTLFHALQHLDLTRGVHGGLVRRSIHGTQLPKHGLGRCSKLGLECRT